MLSCSYDDDNYSWFFEIPSGFSTLQTSRRKRCCSCNNLINKNATVLPFNRYRQFQTEIEQRIYGDSEINIATFYMCEPCGDQYLNLSELGFCIDITENMFDLLKEYQDYIMEQSRRDK